MFKRVASKNPKNAPANKLGAKTPPSPPEASVIDVIMGFNNKTPKIERKNFREKFVFGCAKISLIP